MEETLELSDLNPSTSATSVVAPIGLYAQLFRFATVGLINTGVDLTVLNLLLIFHPAGRIGWQYSVVKTLAFMVAVTNSYLMNRRFTFVARDAATTRQLSHYVLISVGGLLINVGVATAVATFIPAPTALALYWPSIAALAGVPFGLVWNFLGYRFLVF